MLARCFLAAVLERVLAFLLCSRVPQRFLLQFAFAAMSGSYYSLIRQEAAVDRA